MESLGRASAFNDIYSTLVEDSDDILGIIAYSFYKQQKIEFLQAFQAENGRAPSDAELRVFYVTSNSPASLTSYRTKAEALSREFVDAVLAEELRNIEERSDQELNRRVKSFRPNFWSAVAQNIFSSVLFVLLIGVIVFVSWSSKFGTSHAIEQIMGVEIRSKAPDLPAPTQEGVIAPRDH